MYIDLDLDCGEWLAAASWHPRSAETQESLDGTAMSASPAESGHCLFGIGASRPSEWAAGSQSLASNRGALPFPPGEPVPGSGLPWYGGAGRDDAEDYRVQAVREDGAGSANGAARITTGAAAMAPAIGAAARSTSSRRWELVGEPFCQCAGTCGRRNRPDGLGCGRLIELTGRGLLVSVISRHGESALGDLVGHVDHGKVDAGVDEFLQPLLLDHRDHCVAVGCRADDPVRVLPGICPGSANTSAMPR